MGLPEELLEIENGPRGFVEFAFSSATPNKEVALEYAGICDCDAKAQQVTQNVFSYYRMCFLTVESAAVMPKRYRPVPQKF